MVIDQRNAGASVTPSSSAYTLDRWKFITSPGSKFSFQQSSTAPAGFTTSLISTSLSAYSAAAGDVFRLAQFIEGYNVADLGFGTANALTVTVSFWVRSSLTGTFAVTLNNENADRSYVATYTVSSANTWEQKSVTIAGDTTGTWAKTNGVGIGVAFDMGSGTSSNTTAGAWQAGNFSRTSACTSVVGTNGATFYITGVQLEVGTTATNFDYRSYGTELGLCQRYYWKTFPQTVAPAQNSGSYAGSICYVVLLGGANYMATPVYFPVVMRATPSTITFYNPGAANAKWKNGSSGVDSGSAGQTANTSQYGFIALNNPQVAGDTVSNSMYINVTAEAEL
jgi:hypothetical protein